MAADSEIPTHRATYEKVIGLLKYGAIACIVIAFVVIYVISGK